MQFFSRYWVFPPFVWGLFATELLFTIAMLTLFGIADPNTYRTKLWQEGSNHGWNSNPNEILYSYANYRPIKTPIVWSTWLNNYNVVISVLSMFLLLTKVTMMVMNIWFPVMAVVINGALIALYSYSAWGQASHDLTDPQHLQRGPPWYITKSCSVTNGSTIGGIKGYCEQAKAAFALTIVMIFIFFLNFCWAAFSNFFAKKPLSEDDDEEFAPPPGSRGKGVSPDSVTTTEQQWEMKEYGAANVPAAYGAANVPYTPRTQAFHQLGGANDLPLRKF